MSEIRFIFIINDIVIYNTAAAASAVVEHSDVLLIRKK